MNTNDPQPDFLTEQQAHQEAGHAPPDPRLLAGIGGSDLLFKDEVYQIVGCAIEVLNGIGHGLREKLSLPLGGLAVEGRRLPRPLRFLCVLCDLCGE